MVKQTIQIFCRIKPTKAKTGAYELAEDPEGCPQLHFTVPKEQNEGIVNNKKELYKFRFQRIFDQTTKQDEIFDHVAKPVINNVLAGYNGTIFAYGQTGSGKTFTITGGAERYIDRGIIPRTLSYIFDHCSKNSEFTFSIHVSYLEIYNESGYDLLDPKHEASKLEDLPKVALMEDSDQNIHLKNLSTRLAGNEEEALNLLFLGDTNRMIAETPMNQASTRSHCIFTVHVTSREEGSATIRRAKLHLVDLAGSERVSKTGVNGLLLTEAKYINLSLHYLEQVIVSLSDKGRQHIPYRNSMMTSVLRDSLGGNCMTTMIATCSAERKNIDESISTCRFAQRVAMIKNDAILNEELDPKLMIAKLKREIEQLKEELAMATGEQRTDELSEEDIERCEEAVKYYLQNSDPEGVISVGADMRKIQHCFRILKRYVLERKPPDGSTHSPDTPRSTREFPSQQDLSSTNPGEFQKLKDLLQQRDNEINILVNMLKKEKKRAADAVGQLDRLGHAPSARPISAHSEGAMPNGHHRFTTEQEGRQSQQRTSSLDSSRGRSHLPPKEKAKSDIEEKTKKKILGEMSMGRQEAFEIFRRDYEHNQTIADNKAVLKQRYAEAKTFGERVNTSRVKINKLKASIEQHRMSRVMQGLVDPDNPEPDDMETEIKSQIEAEKQSYKETFSRLRALKTEIEHLQHLLERSKVKLLKDFEIWWAEQGAVTQAGGQVPPPAGHAKNAWRTPPMSPNVRHQQHQPDVSPNVLMSDSSPLPSHRGDSRHHPVAPIPGHIRQSLANNNAARGRATDVPEPPSGQELPSGRHAKSQKSRSSSSSTIPLTGDAQADADIMAFLKARQNILKHAQYQNNR